MSRFTTNDEQIAREMGVSLNSRCKMCELFDIQLQRERDAHGSKLLEAQMRHDDEVSQLQGEKAFQSLIIKRHKSRIDQLWMLVFSLGCVVAYLVWEVLR